MANASRFNIDAESAFKAKESVAERVQRSSNNSVKEYNTAFRQASTNLLVVAGILLAFTTSFLVELGKASWLIKVMGTCVIVSLTVSLAFGMVQQLMEAEYFRKNALRIHKLILRIQTKGKVAPEYLTGALDEISDLQGVGVRRWGSVVQLVLLTVALLMISLTTIVYLLS